MPSKRTRIAETVSEEPLPKRALRSQGRPPFDSKKEKKVNTTATKNAPKKGPQPETKGNTSQRETEEESDGGPSYWLMKAEPETRMEKGKDMKFSIDDLKACKGPAGWDGVRNYSARNNLKAMKQGDLAFFYHSNCKEPGIVGIMEIVKAATPDETAFDPSEPYYDPKSSRDNPKWFLVHVEFRRKLERQIGLAELKTYTQGELSEMPLLKMSRLSVSPVPKACWDFIISLEKSL
ncbi:uncharacterized protein LAJ45_09791 [Morchella importuna]|uniref:Thymocyte nuclear protein 1 n=1 Tax=Morchella conica CCBAS932 TaxID=1392247 RepID=A0A3N4KPZ5_9PEZI|nr:uncharacterized protein LAJ45_09791 [Morchella importuna]KAH8146101.1 hypothetical protein LAJ45_09791 [Morchella importuna]RPB11392.1 thymocyte nuclear protein 1-like protein [Morchella conica CCBAS932]